MTIHFYLRYHTRYGQSLSVLTEPPVPGSNNLINALPLTYLNEEFWYGTIEINPKKVKDISYRYLLKEAGKTDILDAEKDRKLSILNYKEKDVIVFDTWNADGDIENTFYTKPFKHVLWNQQSRSLKLKEPKFYTHEFFVKAPLLSADESVCITGSGSMFKNWDLNKLLPLKTNGTCYSLKVNLGKETFPLKYKYGIYNSRTKTFTYESGSDRMLYAEAGKKNITIIHDGFIHLQKYWKGAGIAIPVFSLRSKKDFGVGEFADIKLLVDWAKQANIKLIQILPVNDTTSSYSSKDSYPYAAVSAFALHPLYINLDEVAGTKHASIIKTLNKKKKSLDLLPDLDYEQVIKFKFSALNELYTAKKDSFLSDTDFLKFFKENKEWLIPYTAYCFLRDKYSTADFLKWKSNKSYNETAVQKLVSPAQPHYDEIAIHYFIQYHLHLQLKAASDYAHKNGIILKGDIPIGVSRNSCDVWLDETLYNINEQAGAPPDDFAIKGQNWGFPTYNWDKMQQDGFAWWRKRFAHINKYFDSFRIDHILGFFRIWSIPYHAVEGILGRFVPAIPLHITEFDKNRIWFDYTRYCKPFITDEFLLQQFGENTEQVKKTFLSITEEGHYRLKTDFGNQRKVENYFIDKSLEFDETVKQGLFNVLSNVILIEEEGSEMQQFHFRIAMHQTDSFKQLDQYTQHQLSVLYHDYFFSRQDVLWKKDAMKKLPALKNSTDMLICGEDLGMVPHCVPDVMKHLGILSLEIQRMPKDPSTDFFHPKNAQYLSVVTPSTHDMSTLREWWREDREATQRFYNFLMGHYGKAPENCEFWVTKEIILQHLYSPAMWSIFQIQDLLGMSDKLKREDPYEERINQPADSNHYWKYRMHISLEELIRQREFTKELKQIIIESGRA